MYKNDFATHSIPKTTKVAFEQSFPHSMNVWMNDSSYNKDFAKKTKKVGVISFRPN